MTSFTPSESARARARRIAATVKRTKTGSVHGAGYISETISQCPRHHVCYVPRHTPRENPILLMYDCPVEGCLYTLQIPLKQ